jgi:solute carrier family 25 protein 44
MYITSYEVIRNSLRDYNTTTRGLVAGGVASLVGQSIGVPIDIVSQRLMMEGQQSHKLTAHGQSKVKKKPKRKPIRNASKMIVHVYQTQGYRGFFQGYWASILTFAPTSTIWWGAYSTTTAWAISRRPEGVPLEITQLVCGGFSGLMAGVLCNPMDVVRTRLQVLGGQSMVIVFRQLYAEEGWRMVYKGLSARLMSMVPSSCLIVVAYEMVKRLSLRSDIQLSDLYGY